MVIVEPAGMGLAEDARPISTTSPSLPLSRRLQTSGRVIGGELVRWRVKGQG